MNEPYSPPIQLKRARSAPSTIAEFIPTISERAVLNPKPPRPPRNPRRNASPSSSIAEVDRLPVKQQSDDGHSGGAGERTDARDIMRKVNTLRLYRGGGYYINRSLTATLAPIPQLPSPPDSPLEPRRPRALYMRGRRPTEDWTWAVDDDEKDEKEDEKEDEQHEKEIEEVNETSFLSMASRSTTTLGRRNSTSTSSSSSRQTPSIYSSILPSASIFSSRSFFLPAPSESPKCPLPKDDPVPYTYGFPPHSNAKGISWHAMRRIGRRGKQLMKFSLSGGKGTVVVSLVPIPESMGLPVLTL